MQRFLPGRWLVDTAVVVELCGKKQEGIFVAVS